MWMIVTALGVIALLTGFLAKTLRMRRLLMAAGAVLLVIGLIYGALVLCLLGGID